MAAGSIDCSKQKNAIATVIDHVSNRLAELEAMLDALRKDR